MYLDYAKQPDRYWTIDTEGNSLRPDQFWCAVALNLGTNEELIFDTEAMYDGRFKRFAEDKSIYIVGHNFISWDSHWLRQNKIADISIDRIVDSLVLSYLYNPYLPDGHSLEAYGNRFGVPKIGHDDWSHYSPEMLERCRRDVKINVLTYKALCKRMLDIGYSERSCEIESRVRFVIDKQERRGFYFDKKGAEQLSDKLSDELENLRKPITDLFPPTLKPIKSYLYRQKKDGSDVSSYLRHQQDYDAIKFNEDGSEYTTYAYKPFNIGSPDQRVQKLLSLDWAPTVFTPAGNPKVDEDALKAFAEECGDKRIGLIADWIVRFSRESTIKSWLKVLKEDSRIHGRVFSCGAATRRMTHNSPNTANIPKASDKVLYGKECRSLWTVEDPAKRKLIGYDASGLEMRGFGHYIGGGKAAELYITGDPHSANASAISAAGIPISRHDTKTEFYAFLYGAGNKKLGSILNKGHKVGATIRETLLKTTPGLAKAVDEVVSEFESNGGLLKCIDGGYVRCSSSHSALNYRIQSAGGIVMKLASIKLDQWIEKNGIDSWKVSDVHDEAELDTINNSEVLEAVGKRAIQSIAEAGEELNFKVPLTGQYYIGDSWADVH